MTLIPEFEVLESLGFLTIPKKYRSKPVIAKLGKTSLILLEGDGSPIAHWTLSAIRRTNPGKRPAVFAPYGEGSEFIAIDDETMIRALEQIQKALRIGPARPKRFRWLAVLAVAAAAAIAGAFAAPEFLIRQATALAQKTHGMEIGEAILSEHALTAGAPCSSKYGDAALKNLEMRLFGKFENRLRILPGGTVEIASLPGGIVLVRNTLLQDRLGPAVLGGYLLREDLRARAADPLHAFFAVAGPVDALQFLALRQISQDSVRSATPDYLARPPAQVPAEELRSSFAYAGIPLKPFVEATQARGEESVDLKRLEPIPNHRTVLNDTDWLLLQAICNKAGVR